REDIGSSWSLLAAAGGRGSSLGGSTGCDVFRPPLSTSAPNAEARNIRVIANVFVGGTTPLGFVGCVDCLAANNTIVNPENWLLRILQETTTSGGYTFSPASNGRFVNNLVYFDRGELSTYVNIGANTAPETFTFENNLWYAHDNPGQSQPSGLPSAETGGIAGQDPQLSNAAGGDFHVPSSSPAAGAGKPLAELGADFDRVCYDDPPSI